MIVIEGCSYMIEGCSYEGTYLGMRVSVMSECAYKDTYVGMRVIVILGCAYKGAHIRLFRHAGDCDMRGHI